MLMMEIPTTSVSAPTEDTDGFLDFQNQTLKKFRTNLLCLFVFIYFLHYIFNDRYSYLNKNALCARANTIQRIPIEHATLK